MKITRYSFLVLATAAGMGFLLDRVAFHHRKGTQVGGAERAERRGPPATGAQLGVSFGTTVAYVGQHTQQAQRSWDIAEGFPALAAAARTAAPGLEPARRLDDEQPCPAKAILCAWSAADPRAAARWAIENLPVAAQADALSAVAVTWTRQSPADAATFAANLPAGDAQKAMVTTILTSWASFDPSGAASWVSQFPDGNLRKLSMQDVAIGWAVKNPAGAANWLQGLTAGSSRDAAIGAFVGVVADSNPALAAVWAESIDDTEERLLRMEGVAHTWMETDAAGARLWVQNAPFEDSMKTRLLGGH